MDVALVAGAAMLGLAGTPHCAAMCAAPCAAVTGAATDRGDPRLWAFHGARTLSYMLAGALVASSVGALALVGQWSPALRPLWTLLHAAALVLGLFLLWQGRQPAWLESLGRGSARAAAPVGRWQALHGPGRAGAAGAMWAAWPCGLLHSALLMAALANGPLGGAVVMGAFALVTALGLVVGPALWSFLGARGSSAKVTTWSVRLAGAMLVVASGWALTHGLWTRFLAWCLA